MVDGLGLGAAEATPQVVPGQHSPPDRFPLGRLEEGVIPGPPLCGRDSAPQNTSTSQSSVGSQGTYNSFTAPVSQSRTQ